MAATELQLMELEDNSAKGCEGPEVESIVRDRVFLMAWLKDRIISDDFFV